MMSKTTLKTIAAVAFIAVGLLVVLMMPVTRGLIDVAASSIEKPVDESSAFGQAIRDRYGSEVVSLKVKQVHEVETSSDVPFGDKYDWGYRASWRLKGVPLTFHLLGVDPAEVQLNSGYSEGLFPDEFGLTDEEFRRVLLAYGRGPAESLMRVEVEDGATNPDDASRSYIFYLYPDGSDTSTREDSYVVVFDRDTGVAIYGEKYAPNTAY
jgi:hypothetical protein